MPGEQRGEVVVVASPSEAGVKCAEDIISLLKAKKEKNSPFVLGLATGSTPIPAYAHLQKRFLEDESIDFSEVITYNLDEYAGIPPSHPQSYRYFMFENLFTSDLLYSAKNPRGFRQENIHLPEGEVTDPSSLSKEEKDLFLPADFDGEKIPLENQEKILERRAKAYDKAVLSANVDIQILGIGHNGHIGFCEPGAPFDGCTCVVSLCQQTREANSRFFDGKIEEVPRFAVSMGIATILSASRIILIATGEGKKEIVGKLLQYREEGKSDPDLPASALFQHKQNSVLFIFDEKARE